MSVGYRAVGWNRQKRLYDRVLAAGVLAYLAVFLGVGAAWNPNATVETLVIRAFGSAAFLLLHLVLSIGPLARFDRRFLPLLYNRRHMGVTTFALALVHGAFAVFQFHALGEEHPLVSVLTASTRYGSLAWFPFQPLGLAALVVLFLMAATSHDFWLANLGAPLWKALHMAVYPAYALVVAHVLLGALQAERSPLLAGLVGVGAVWVVALHLAAARREARFDRYRIAEARAEAAGDEELLDVGSVEEIPMNRAKVVVASGERVAVFRHAGGLSAVSNACRHQNGPLGEGRILDGCITCPWHGYQYLPETGASPPPFEEQVPTYRVRTVRGRVLLDPRPRPPGTSLPPAPVPSGAAPPPPAAGGEA